MNVLAIAPPAPAPQQFDAADWLARFEAAGGVCIVAPTLIGGSDDHLQLWMPIEGDDPFDALQQELRGSGPLVADIIRKRGMVPA